MSIFVLIKFNYIWVKYINPTCRVRVSLPFVSLLSLVLLVITLLLGNIFQGDAQFWGFWGYRLACLHEFAPSPTIEGFTADKSSERQYDMTHMSRKAREIPDWELAASFRDQYPNQGFFPISLRLDVALLIRKSSVRLNRAYKQENKPVISHQKLLQPKLGGMIAKLCNGF